MMRRFQMTGRSVLGEDAMDRPLTTGDMAG